MDYEFSRKFKAILLYVSTKTNIYTNVPNIQNVCSVIIDRYKNNHLMGGIASNRHGTVLFNLFKI